MSQWIKTSEGWKKTAGNARSSGGSGGSSDYNDLSNKPKINGIELIENKSLDALGIASASDLNDLADLVGEANALLEEV